MNSSPETIQLFYRADANAQMGAGHIFRGLFIQYYWSRTGGEFFFVTHSLPKNLCHILQKNGANIIATSDSESDTLHEVTATYGSGIWVTDGDHEDFYTKQYQDEVREQGHCLAMITFRNDCHFMADIIHNQNIRALDLEYSTEPYTKQLLGPRYLILNPSLLEHLEDAPKRKKNAILLSFGSSNSSKRIEKILTILLKHNELANYHFDLVIGDFPEYIQKLKGLLDAKNVSYQFHQGHSDMGQLMSRAIFAFSSGGLTTWELGVLGVPHFVYPATEREKLTAKEIQKRDIAAVLPSDQSIEEIEETILYYWKHWHQFQDKTARLRRHVNPYGGELFSRELASCYE